MHGGWNGRTEFRWSCRSGARRDSQRDAGNLRISAANGRTGCRGNTSLVSGIGTGQFIEASYWAMDKQDNLYAGDTSVGRITKMVAPKNRSDQR